jgi:cytoskeletal protein CcmA (bactofilin family)
MAIWKEQAVQRKDSSLGPQDLPGRNDVDSSLDKTPSFAPAPTPTSTPTPRVRSKDAKESLIAADLTIEGKIEGSGHVRMAGRFKGDVNVEGDLTIDQGAKITGSVRASTVTVGGELDGNIDAASRVELLSTGVLNGDLKAASLTVAAGSRMRGNVSFGWDDVPVSQPRLRMESPAAS